MRLSIAFATNMVLAIALLAGCAASSLVRRATSPPRHPSRAD